MRTSHLKHLPTDLTLRCSDIVKGLTGLVIETDLHTTLHRYTTWVVYNYGAREGEMSQ